MTANPEEVYALWREKRYMQALQTAWQLSPFYPSYASLHRGGMSLHALIVRACREAVAQAEQEEGRAQSQQWLAGFLHNFSLPAVLKDYYGGKSNDSALNHLSMMIYAWLCCAEVALDRPWTALTVAPAALQPVT